MKTAEQDLNQVIEEVKQTPAEYWPALAQLIRVFREAVVLEPAEATFRRGWQEAIQGQVQDLSTLWDGIDAD